MHSSIAARPRYSLIRVSTLLIVALATWLFINALSGDSSILPDVRGIHSSGSVRGGPAAPVPVLPHREDIFVQFAPAHRFETSLKSAYCVAIMQNHCCSVVPTPRMSALTFGPNSATTMMERTPVIQFTKPSWLRPRLTLPLMVGAVSSFGTTVSLLPHSFLTGTLISFIYNARHDYRSVLDRHSCMGQQSSQRRLPIRTRLSRCLRDRGRLLGYVQRRIGQ